MQLSKVCAKTSNFIQKNETGKNKIPRFIYHLTNMESLEQIKSSGMLKMGGNDYFAGNAIFMFEIDNLFKNWINAKVGTCSMLLMLLQQASKGFKNLVLIKIPTGKLDINKLFIRDQNIFFNWLAQKLPKEAKPIFKELIKRENEKNLPLFGKKQFQRLMQLESEAKDVWYERCASPETKAHMEGKTPAVKSGLFKQRKVPFEYIYRDNIPFDNIEVIGNSYCDINKKSPIELVINIYKTLLKGTPEENCLKNFNNKFV